jgi:hypothetical protein
VLLSLEKWEGMMSVPVAATAAFVLCASASASAADYTGFWKRDCTYPSGISIKPGADKRYSISLCHPSGCDPWKPNTTIDGDPQYQVVDADTLDLRESATRWARYKKCTTETNPKLEFATNRGQAQASPPAPAQPSPSGAVPRLNPAWVGTWKSQDGTTTVTISPAKMVRSFLEKDSHGKMSPKTPEFRWTENGDPEPGEFGYGRYPTSPAEVLKWYEAAVRQFKKDPADFAISDPKASRQAIAAISPGSYRVLLSTGGGDCEGWDFILDGDRMLEVSECKYGFEVALYNRASAR